MDQRQHLINFSVLWLLWTANAHQLSSIGTQCIKSIQGFCRYCNKNNEDAWILGYGHVFDTKALCCDKEYSINTGDELFDADLQMSINCVNRIIHTNITNEQFAALVNVARDYGCGGFSRTYLIKLINAGKLRLAAKCLLRLDQPMSTKRIEKHLFDGTHVSHMCKITICKQSSSQCPIMPCEQKLNYIKHVLS